MEEKKEHKMKKIYKKKKLSGQSIQALCWKHSLEEKYLSIGKREKPINKNKKIIIIISLRRLVVTNWFYCLWIRGVEEEKVFGGLLILLLKCRSRASNFGLFMEGGREGKEEGEGGGRDSSVWESSGRKKIVILQSLLLLCYEG